MKRENDWHDSLQNGTHVAFRHRELWGQVEGKSDRDAPLPEEHGEIAAEKNGGYSRFHYGDGIFTANVILRAGHKNETGK